MVKKETELERLQRIARARRETAERIGRMNTMPNFFTVVEARGKDTKDYLEEVEKKAIEEQRQESEKQRQPRPHWWLSQDGQTVFVSRNGKIEEVYSAGEWANKKSKEIAAKKHVQ